MIDKEIIVQFWDEKLHKEFLELKDGAGEDQDRYRFIERALDDLKRDPACGIKIPQRLIPKIYLQNLDVNNLWKYDLPGAWRLIYTLKADKVMILAIVIEWLDHKDYEKRFGYK